jgi:uncharacterized membrane protein YphA (DoxX/SURF4 family)
MKFLTPALRILSGLAYIVFGINGFVPFMPVPETLPQGAVDFVTALTNSGYMVQLIGATQIVAGLLLVFNRFVPLALVFLAPFLVNSIAFHVTLEPTGLPMALVFTAIEVYLAWVYRDAFRPMLRAKVLPAGSGRG